MTCKGIRRSWWLVPLQHYIAVFSILEHSLQERVCAHETREVNKLHKSGKNWTCKIYEGPFPKWQLQKTLLGQDAEPHSCWRRLLWPAVCRRMSGPESIREHHVKQSKPGPLKVLHVLGCTQGAACKPCRELWVCSFQESYVWWALQPCICFGLISAPLSNPSPLLL